MQIYEQLENGIYIPSPPDEEQIMEMVESPMMQFLTLNLFNAWTLNEGNHRTAWNSPLYSQLALVQDTAMQGIELIQKADYVPQSKGWVVTSMLARGVSLARLSCLSLALGSFSDAFSNYRMLLEREMTIKYLETNKQFEAFAKAFYAEIYHREGKGLNDEQLRKGYTSGDLEQSKQIMELIRTKFFDNKPPKAPGAYWSRPKSQELVDEYAKGPSSNSDAARQNKEAMRAYDLGNRSVHPQLKDMIQPEDSDITPEALEGLILIALGGLTTFGLSLFEESSPLANKIEKIILQTPSGKSIWEMIQANRTYN